MYSVNAFGSDEIDARAKPPDFFSDGTAPRRWKVPPATVCIWPYEQMYSPDLRKGENGGYDYDARLARAREYFAQIEPGKSLIFYYANYSNPFADEEHRRYVVVGVSRVKQVGEELFYRNCSPEVKRRYGGGFVWQRNLTSEYPDQGLRLPYHLYLERPDVLEKLVLFPDNPRNFKYGTRHISDDAALVLIERLLETTAFLRDLGDRSEDWSLRINWLQSLIAELWQSRGLYPGLPKVLNHLGFGDAVPYLKAQSTMGREEEAVGAIFRCLGGEAASIPGVVLPDAALKKARKQWLLRDEQEQRLLREVFPRFDLSEEQLSRILLEERAGWSLYATLPELAENPYIIAEQYLGDGPDDTISFSKVDHGVFPSPELGGEPLADKDDWRRLRALCVERLRTEETQAFLGASQVLHDANHKLSFLPEWKRHQFSDRYLRAYEEELSGALTFREVDGRRYLYLKDVYEDEREIEQQVRALANRPDISFRSPVTDRHWHDYLYDPGSPLARVNPGEYETAIVGQGDICRRIFVRPVCVLSGAAGTGKTTVIKALIQAVEKAHGTGTTFQLLAPTGKAAERIREATGKPAATVHSFLAQHGWLNPNLSCKRSGGRREDAISTYIIDEASMMDLKLMATLFRAIHWSTVQRLILVGDPNQLPPIGRGKVFVDVIDWLLGQQPDSVGRLEINIRQMENRLKGQRTGILDLASLYVRRRLADVKDETETSAAERILQSVQEGGDVAQDLRVLYWRDPEDLANQLTQTIAADMERDSGLTLDLEHPEKLWEAAFKNGGDRRTPEYMQVLSPYRGEEYGTDRLNALLQGECNGATLERVGHVGGVTLYDKVIQVVNRPRSNPVSAYSQTTRQKEKIEVFNGEMGFAEPHLLDRAKDQRGHTPLYARDFRVERLQVVLSRKPEYRIEVLGRSFVEENLELGYAVSVHKAQGSEFERVYFVVPKNKRTLMSPELFYTGLTRARRHCTLLIEEDISPLLTMRRPENSRLTGINSSLFDFRPVADELAQRRDWYAEGKIHRTLAEVMVRSKSEVIIANLLFDRDIPFTYELPLYAPDGTFYLPDFTVTWSGEKWYWEHVGLLNDEGYRNHWETKKAWYEKFFPGRLVVTQESSTLSHDCVALIEQHFS
jgi:hypothetical protein